MEALDLPAINHACYACTHANTPATSVMPGRSCLCRAVSAAASGSLVIWREGEPAEGTSPAAMAALRIRDIEAWDSPAGTVRHQRTVDGWNLQERLWDKQNWQLSSTHLSRALS